MRRARPLLGTIVDIRAWDRGKMTETALEAGFTAITRIQRLMSFHETESDVSRLNREAWRGAVKVHPLTWRVLKAAQEFSKRSAGVFDITIAPSLAGWNYLPALHAQEDKCARWRDIVLLSKGSVRFRRKLAIDLGGIAKGFAVDRAVEAMRRAGASGGLVNAGGDARAFGESSEIFRLRHPADPFNSAGTIALRQCALATSASYFTRERRNGEWVSPLIDGRTRRAIAGSLSVTVTAPTCLVADALTKIVFALGGKAASLLKTYRADALLIEQSGSAHRLSQMHVD